jgi:hypothetical protein
LQTALEAQCDGLLLVATRQEPPHVGDTWRLAGLMRPLLEGRGVVVRLVEVQRFEVDGFRAATEAGLRELLSQFQVGEVVLIMGGGPKVGFIGAFLGTIQVVDSLPQVLEPRLAGEVRPASEVRRLEADLVPWLVRTHQYDVLAGLAEIGAAERRVWRALAAARALDWRALSRVQVEEGDLEAVRSSHPEALALESSSPPEGMGNKPHGEVGWRWYRRVLQASLLVRAVSDPVSALYVARPWTDCHVRELSFQDSANRGHELVCALDGPGADEALGSLLERWTELAPGPIRTLVGAPAVQQLCWLGGLASHGRFDGHDWPHHQLGALVALAEGLGLEAIPQVAGGLLLLMAVGQTEVREARGWGPEEQAEAALEAIVEYLAVRLLLRERVHLRLIASERVRTHAQRISDGASRRRFGSVETIDVDPMDTRTVLKGIVGRLDSDPKLAGCSEVLLVVGPGTKHMNVAVVLGGGQWGTSRALPLRVAYLHERERQGRWSSILEEAHERVLPRLGPDEVVAPILVFALRRLDLGTVRRALELGSNRWAKLENGVIELQRLLTPARGGRRGTPDPRAWFPARARAFATLAEDDPWRAVYATCAAAEAAWPSPERRRGGGHRPSPWRVPARPHGHELWRKRNEGPFGHQVWALPPEAEEIRRLVEGVIEEVRCDPSNQAVPFVPEDAIVQRIEELVKAVHDLAPVAPR